MPLATPDAVKVSARLLGALVLDISKSVSHI